MRKEEIITFYREWLKKPVSTEMEAAVQGALQAGVDPVQIDNCCLTMG